MKYTGMATAKTTRHSAAGFINDQIDVLPSKGNSQAQATSLKRPPRSRHRLSDKSMATVRPATSPLSTARDRLQRHMIALSDTVSVGDETRCGAFGTGVAKNPRRHS